MKKLLSIGLAAALGAASLATTVPAASAQPAGFQNGYVQEAGWRGKRSWRGKHSWRGQRSWRGSRNHYRYRYHRRHRSNDFGAAAAGAIFGLALGAMTSHRSYSGGGSAHVNWCLNRYRTYNPRTNLYYYVPGRQRHCNSPYN